ncbi:hypothetical protein [Planctomicrobium piriforme]|uniref:Neutral/alkaline non-lysosomal ceramidase, N-terminal n=1 Tax=Planctomicrobium piriforme TaxID=1576369 RepID=A0A1I3GME8_9PLAN|nr:hypothetical protein [Planctomicrobium piriforme]SFI24461.1 hypothetical protein SAMN05421753_10749 [Planctomicrobium piriforme]
MIRSCLLLLVLALPGVLSASSSMLLADDGAAFTVGSAERDITPEIGMEQPGDYRKSFHKTLHDPCKVRAAVFSDGKSRVALVSIDALMVRRELVLAARKRITTECGIPGEAVLIHATHSHSSGPTGMIVPGEFDNASPLIQKLAYESSSNANLDYLKTVEEAVVSAVVSADQSRAAAKCSVGSGHEDQIAFNRRFFMRNGMTYTHPGAGNPEIVEPAGPIDPQVGVVGVWNDKQQLTTCVVNYACHATTSPGGISANYVYEMEKVIRGVFGEQVIVVFLAGASGDVTQVDNLTTQERPKADQWMRMVGGSIGAEAVKVLYKSEPGVLAPIAFKSKVWSIPRRVPSQEHVQKALEIVQQSPEAVGIPVWTFAKETVLLDEAIKHHPKVEVEVQAIQIGPAVFLTDPAEFFCGLGLAIKAGSPFPLTFPVSLANGCVGYVPSPEAFGPRGGGYETRLTFYSNLEVTAGQQFVDAAVELAKSMTPGTIPARPTLPPFKGNPWAYGSVPPELD